MGQYKHLLQRQQQQQKAKESLIKDASTSCTLNDAQQQEQLHQAEHIWGGLQVCTLLWTLIVYVYLGFKHVKYAVQVRTPV